MFWYEWLIFVILILLLTFIIVAVYNALTGNPTIYANFKEPSFGALTGLVNSSFTTGGGDPFNCGGPGRFCDPSLGLVCIQGACICGQTGTTFCPNYGCVDLLTFSPSCGSCSNTGCASNEKCCGGVCINVNTITNCGNCGVSCTGVNPRCCAGICKDLNSDNQNCGACFQTVPINSWCCSGTIQPVNDQNCTACGSACPTGFICDVPNRQCVPGCPTGFTQCPNGACVDLQNDNFNCVFCGSVCATGSFCRGNGCVSNLCQTGSFFTNGVCIPLNTNDNCGQLGLSCPSFCNPSGFCSCTTSVDCPIGYSCNGISCLPPGCGPGQIFCGASAACVSLNSNPNNCGACGVVCASGVCINGKCSCSSSSQCGVGFDCIDQICQLH